MWSMPSIESINECKEKEFHSLKVVEGGISIKGKIQKCEYCEEKATGVVKLYDIFSNIPRLVPICDSEKCQEYADDETFYCDECKRQFVNNITWELYGTDYNGSFVCLNCASKLFFDDTANWYGSKAEIEALTIEDVGKKAVHIGGVANPNFPPKGIKSLGSVTLDGFSGEKVVGFCSTSSAGISLRELKDLLISGLKGKHRVTFALTGAYQFAVDVEVFSRK